MDRGNRYVSTAQVAQALGLSVTTIKRWIDDGILPAHRTAGGHRKVLAADVLRAARETGLPEGDISKLFPRARYADLSNPVGVRDQLLAALREADQPRVRSVLLGAHGQGFPASLLADEVIGSALTELGRDWEAGRIGVMHEHRATQAVLAALYELLATERVQGDRDRPLAVGGSPADDPTLVPTILAKLVLADSGWQAVNLGPNTPTAALVAAMDEYRPQLVWVCVTHLADPNRFLADYQDLYREAKRRAIPVAVGGQALTKALREQMPYTTFGDGMAHLVAFARTLYQRPGRPRKGRPPKRGRRPASRD